MLRLPPHNIAHVTFTQPFQCDLHPQLQDTHRTTHTGTTIPAKHRGGTNRVRNDRSRNCRTDESRPRYLSSPAAATLHGITQGFVLWLPPHNIAHVTFTQPFQCDLQPDDLPPFITVNSIASCSFAMCCYVMYCYMIYHPSSRSIP